MTKMAKKVSFSHRTSVFLNNTHLLTPFSICLPNDRGMAAPMLKRKNGNTRSTQVMPKICGLKT